MPVRNSSTRHDQFDIDNWTLWIPKKLVEECRTMRHWLCGRSIGSSSEDSAFICVTTAIAEWQLLPGQKLHSEVRGRPRTRTTTIGLHRKTVTPLQAFWPWSSMLEQPCRDMGVSTKLWC